MAKAKVNALNILDILKDLKNNKILPIYCLFGEDNYNIEAVTEEIQKTADKFIDSDFDKETFHGEDKNLAEVLNFASAFPFGSSKKLIILKEFDKVKDKKLLASYCQSPPEFTILVLIHTGAISNPDTEPFKSLAAHNYLYEAKELKGANLVSWLISFAESKGKTLSHDNAGYLIDISGENRQMLEAQLDKIFTFLGDSQEITYEAIKALSTSLKEYTIFDLQNAIGKRNKNAALKIAFNMIEKGLGMTYIVHMLTRYFTGLARVNELVDQNMPEQAAARIVGTHFYYYKDYIAARKNYPDLKLADAIRALLKADISVKTTSIDEKSLVTMLIGEMMK
jgi:DNA polymerase-3 subunit delta